MEYSAVCWAEAAAAANFFIRAHTSEAVITFPHILFFIFIVFLLQLPVAPDALCGPAGTELDASPGFDKADTPSERFNTFNNLVRDSMIGQHEGSISFKVLLQS